MPLWIVRLGIWWLRRYGATRINLYLTNVTGPREPLWLAGSRLHTTVPIAPISAGVPIGGAVASYSGNVALSVNTSPELGLDRFCEAASGTAKELIGRDSARGEWRSHSVPVRDIGA